MSPTSPQQPGTALVKAKRNPVASQLSASLRPMHQGASTSLLHFPEQIISWQTAAFPLVPHRQLRSSWEGSTAQGTVTQS